MFIGLSRLSRLVIVARCIGRESDWPGLIASIVQRVLLRVFGVRDSRMPTQSFTLGPVSPLRLLPSYLGTESFGGAIRSTRGHQVLMREILLNDRLDFTLRQADTFVQPAFHTAGR